MGEERQIVGVEKDDTAIRVVEVSESTPASPHMPAQEREAQ